ncbi:hypothetical protein FRB95_007083 [Tulasnella sp. JGI-2019a]|nr:hypothetical protein FRB95_007083 [Tulasnella sp. JGI-2019a]
MNHVAIQHIVTFLVEPLVSYFPSDTLEALQQALILSFSSLKNNGTPPRRPLTLLLSPTAPPPSIIQSALKALPPEVGLQWPDWIMLLGQGNPVVLSISSNPGRITTAIRNITNNVMEFETIWEGNEMKNARQDVPNTQEFESDVEPKAQTGSHKISGHTLGAEPNPEYAGGNPSLKTTPSGGEESGMKEKQHMPDSTRVQHVNQGQRENEPPSLRGINNSEVVTVVSNSSVPPSLDLQKERGRTYQPPPHPRARKIPRDIDTYGEKGTRVAGASVGDLVERGTATSLSGETIQSTRTRSTSRKRGSETAFKAGSHASPSVVRGEELIHGIGSRRTSPDRSSVPAVGDEPPGLPNLETQLGVLKKFYARTAFPSAQEREDLARELYLTPRQVQVWFQRRRQNPNATLPPVSTLSRPPQQSLSGPLVPALAQITETLEVGLEPQGSDDTQAVPGVRSSGQASSHEALGNLAVHDSLIQTDKSTSYEQQRISLTSLLSSGSRKGRPRYRRRGSSSSAPSMVSSCFKEQSDSSGSSGSRSRSPRDQSRLGSAAIDQMSTSSRPRLKKKITSFLFGAPKVANVTDLAATLIEPSQTVASSLRTVDQLLTIAEKPHGRSRVVKELCGGVLDTSGTILQRLMSLADMESPGAVLARDCSIARLLSMLLEDESSFRPVLTRHVTTGTLNGAAGVRFALRRTGRNIPLDEPQSLTLIGHATEILFWTIDSYHALRLCELVYRTYPELDTLPSMNMAFYLKQTGRTKLAALQLIRSSPRPTDTSAHDMLLSIVLNIFKDNSEDAEVRCIALAAYMVLMNSRSTFEAPDEQGIRLLVSILLWQQDWQHCHNIIAAKWDVQKVMPHDDAYSILSRCTSSAILQSSLHEYFDFSRTGTTILEALMALIVDYSVEKDAQWPAVLSALIQSGITSYLHSVITLPIPMDETLATYRDTTRAISDGIVGVMHCAEQLTRSDFEYVDPAVVQGLAALASNESLPMMVQTQAKMALEAWDASFLGFAQRDMHGDEAKTDRLAHNL